MDPSAAPVADPDASWRCFVALAPDAGSFARVRDEQVRLRKLLPDAALRWTPPDDLHLTVRFLGAAAAGRRAALLAGLPALALTRTPICARSRGLAFWPTRVQARVLVLPVESQGALEALAADIEDLARACGFAAEPRRFRAHLTMARIKQGVSVFTDVRLNPAPIELCLDTLALYRSEPLATGSCYTPLGAFGLNAAPVVRAPQ